MKETGIANEGCEAARLGQVYERIRLPLPYPSGQPAKLREIT
jgi:hypothetical protein